MKENFFAYKLSNNQIKGVVKVVEDSLQRRTNGSSDEFRPIGIVCAWLGRVTLLVRRPNERPKKKVVRRSELKSREIIATKETNF